MAVAAFFDGQREQKTKKPNQRYYCVILYIISTTERLAKTLFACQIGLFFIFVLSIPEGRAGI